MLKPVSLQSFTRASAQADADVRAGRVPALLPTLPETMSRDAFLQTQGDLRDASRQLRDRSWAQEPTLADVSAALETRADAAEAARREGWTRLALGATAVAATVAAAVGLSVATGNLGGALGLLCVVPMPLAGAGLMVAGEIPSAESVARQRQVADLCQGWLVALQHNGATL